MDGFILFLISMGIVFIFSLSGKVGMGFQIPGIARPLPYKYKEILNKYFPYYCQLNSKNQELFRQKLQYFIHVKDFIPRNIESVSDEMKVLISACAVQLTFGFPKVMLSHFKRILIYPDNYYSTINQQYHKGEVNPRLQAIVLSWSSFVQGYIDSNNGRNLGLHEMAHALRLENRIFNGEYDFLDKDTLAEWYQLAEDEISRIRVGESRMFRDYAGTNHDEFFSIAVENFFERPAQFFEQMPVLYALMSKMLRQDPLRNFRQVT